MKLEPTVLMKWDSEIFMYLNYSANLLFNNILNRKLHALFMLQDSTRLRHHNIYMYYKTAQSINVDGFPQHLPEL